MLFPAKTKTAGSPPRVVVTGLGIVTPLGNGWGRNGLGFRTGRTAFGPVSLFDVSRQRVRTAAEVVLPPVLPGVRLSPRQVGRVDRASAMLLLAGHEAWTQSGWEPGEDLPLVLGTTAGGMALGEAYFRTAVQSPQQHRQQPTRALHYQAQTQARLLGEALGFSGPITIISNACASGANAVGHAWRLLRGGRAERVLAGGYDALCQMVFAGFDSLQTLSPTACRPFDARRDGLALGEGAGVLALETLDSAYQRGASILAELVAYGTTIDPHHLTQPQPEGNGAVTAMALACAVAGLGPAEVDYVNAHGTGTLLNDSAEAAAINRWAGARAASLPVSSTKACIGHLLGAAGAVEAAVCVICLPEQWLPPEATLETLDPVCNFPVVVRPRDARLNVVLTNSFGFGGVNATLILRRWA